MAGYVCSKKAATVEMPYEELLKVHISEPRGGGVVGVVGVNISRVGFVCRQGLVNRGYLEGTGYAGTMEGLARSAESLKGFF